MSTRREALLPQDGTPRSEWDGTPRSERDRTPRRERNMRRDPTQPINTAALHPLPPVAVTPWSTYLRGVVVLGFCLATMVLLQIVWYAGWRGNGTVCWLPISLLALPPVAWICRPHLGPLRVEGMAHMLEWLLQDSPGLRRACLGKTACKPEATSQLEQVDQYDDHASMCNEHACSPEGRTRYWIGYGAMFVVFWLLVVGMSIWPFGYLYLADYSFVRCQGICKQLEKAGNEKEKTSRWLVLPDNMTWGIHQLRDGCTRATDNWRDRGSSIVWPQMESLDVHRLLPPQHAQAIGYDFQLKLTPHVGKPFSFRPGCETGRHQRIFVLLISGALAVAAAIPLFCRRRDVSAALVVLEVVLIAGAALVWRSWGACAGEGHPTPDDVLAALLSSCNKTTFYTATPKSTTGDAHQFYVMFWQFEKRFRRAHQISRYELWMGRWIAAFWLLLSVMAHSISRYKRMQTREARTALLRQHPRLVARLLQRDCQLYLKSLPGWHGIRLLSNLRKAHKDPQDDCFHWLKQEKPYSSHLEGAGTSFRPAFLYASGRALMPTFGHLIFSSPLPGESTLLVMLSCLATAVLIFLVYLFTYFQLCEAVRHYERNVKVWLLFDTCWKFPSRSGLMGDPLMETAQTIDSADREALMFREYTDVLTDFGGRNEVIPEWGSEDEVANLDNVKTSLGTWWAWREYLVVDQMDKRVRLELHLLLTLVSSVSSFLLFTAGTSWADCLNTDSPESLAWMLSHEATEHVTQALLAVWALLFFTWPLMRSLKCASDMNYRLGQQLSNVVHLKDVVLQQTGMEQERQLINKVGPTALNVFRLAREEQEAMQGRSALQVFNLIKIDSRTLKIVGVLLSCLTGGQFIDLGGKVLQTLD